MKTLSQKIETCVAYGNAYSTSYNYKMGGDTRLVIRNSKNEILLDQTFNHKEYYSGRGSKYNKSVKHGYILEEISLKEFNSRFKKADTYFKERKRYDLLAKKEAKLYAKTDFTTLEKHLTNNLTIIKDNEYTIDERYWLNGYHGCGVYRLFFNQKGRIVAILSGGYGQSLPSNKFGSVDYNKWVDFVNTYVDNKVNEPFQSAKADGSGTYFYLREELDFVETKNYFVPSYKGGMHLNIEIN